QRLQRLGWHARAVKLPVAQDGFARLVKRDDVFVVLGAPWSGPDPDYAKLLEMHRTRYGLQFALLVYDIIPLRRPEWFEHRLVAAFNASYAALMPVADRLFAISRATANDVEHYAKENEIVLRSTVHVVPMGTTIHASHQGSAVPSPRLPAPGSFV